MFSHQPDENRLDSIPLRQLDQLSRPSLNSENHGESLSAPGSRVHSSSSTPKSSRSPSRVGTPRSARRKFQHDWWMWEVLGIVTSAISLGAMLAVLLYFDDERRPVWAFGITINSVLSLTSTIAKSALLIPISEGLSQMKWIWFTERGRDLQDMQYFEEASRGPWGSLFLLFRLRFRHLGTLGAFVTIVALALDPTVQLLVQERTRVVSSSNETAIAAASQLYGDYEPGPVLSYSTAPLNMKAATYTGLLAFDSSNKPKVQCPSGSCTWSNYSSLAVCWTCQNITSHIHVNCTSTRACSSSIPGGVSLLKDSLSETADALATNSTFKPLFYKTFSAKAHVLGGFQGIATFPKPGVSLSQEVSAAECMIYLCVNSYRSRVENGNFTEEIVETWPNITSNTQETPPEVGDGQLVERYLNVSGVKYGMSGWTFSAVKEHLGGGLLVGTITAAGRSGWTYTFSSDVMQAIWGYSSFEEPINRLAAAMTKNIRDGGSHTDLSIKGDVYRPETYIKVQWWWMTIPVFLFLATVVQFLMTVLKTRRLGAGIWRSSALVLAFHGLDRDSDEAANARLKRVVAGNEDEDENEGTLMSAAKGMQVRMIRFEDGSVKLTSANHIRGED